MVEINLSEDGVVTIGQWYVAAHSHFDQHHLLNYLQCISEAWEGLWELIPRDVLTCKKSFQIICSEGDWLLLLTHCQWYPEFPRFFTFFKIIAIASFYGDFETNCAGRSCLLIGVFQAFPRSWLFLSILRGYRVQDWVACDRKTSIQHVFHSRFYA